MSRTSLLAAAVQEFERQFILTELKRRAWNRVQTARELGLTYRGLRYKLARLGIRPPAKDSDAPTAA